MAVSKIVKYGLEELVIDMRNGIGARGAIVDACNDVLRERNVTDRISLGSVRRYLRSLDEEIVAVAHQPRHTERAVGLTLDFAGQFNDLNAKLRRWVEEADTRPDPNWAERIAMARELRAHLELFVDVMEKLYNAEQARLFQQTVLAVIEEASPEMASDITRRLIESQGLRVRAILGQ